MIGRTGVMVLELWDVLRRRKMVRSYRPDPVPREVLERVLGSVVHAPSAGFTQGNEFLVLSDATAVADFYRITRDEFASPRERIVALRRPAGDLVHYGRW